MATYDYRNCQSLFGYAATVHQRSGGVCQLCGCGSGELDFDLWRQMTVEHLIGASQGGYLQQIRAALANRFPMFEPDALRELAERIDTANTITACSFCNSTTSRARAPMSMTDAITAAPHGSPDAVFAAVIHRLQEVLDAKRGDVRWKLESVRAAYDAEVEPRLRMVRERGSRA